MTVEWPRTVGGGPRRCCPPLAPRPTRGSAQHQLPTGLERRPLAGRLSHQLGPPAGLCGDCSSCPSCWGKSVRPPFSAPLSSLLLVLNMIPLGLLFADLRPTLARLYTREAACGSLRMLTFACATLIPLCPGARWGQPPIDVRRGDVPFAGEPDHPLSDRQDSTHFAIRSSSLFRLSGRTRNAQNS